MPETPPAATAVTTGPRLAAPSSRAQKDQAVWATSTLGTAKREGNRAIGGGPC